MNESAKLYCILIYPTMRVAATGLNINEAAQWISTYNAIIEGHTIRAVIDEEIVKHEPITQTES